MYMFYCKLKRRFVYFRSPTVADEVRTCLKIVNDSMRDVLTTIPPYQV